MYSKLLFFCITVTLLFSGSASIPLQKRLIGQGTFYDVGLGACGQTSTPDQLIAAAGASRFDSTKGICGQQASITGPKGSVTVTILDRCAGCGDNDLDLSKGAFQQIASFDQGRVSISWTLGGGGGGGDGNPPPKAVPEPPKAAPAAPAAPETTTTTSTTSTSTTSTSTTSTTTTSTTTTSTTTTPTPTPTPTEDAPSVNNVAAAFFLGSVFSDLANSNSTLANNTTTAQP